MKKPLSVVSNFLASWVGLSMLWIVACWIVVCMVSLVVSPIPSELSGAAKDAYIDAYSTQLMAQAGPKILIFGPLLALVGMTLDASKRQRGR